jgi:hypothetical protein
MLLANTYGQGEVMQREISHYPCEKNQAGRVMEIKAPRNQVA